MRACAQIALAHGPGERRARRKSLEFGESSLGAKLAVATENLVRSDEVFGLHGESIAV
jgi:hypothetical protein